MIVALNILLSCTESTNNKRLCEALHGPGNGELEILPLMIGKGKQKKKKERRKYIKKDAIKIKGHVSMGNMCIFGW
jgi:hypothetical protein